ncbi:MAG: cell division protein FtsQ [Chloroflexota bacterium]|nr:cell division protein FtsQ [Chloroflexota bacterium]
MRLPIRRRAAGRRTARVQRQSSWISRTRLLAALGLAGVSAGFYGLTAAKEFVVDPAQVTIDGVRYADSLEVRADLGLGDEADLSDGALAARNLFRLRTDDMRRRIESQPAVLSASVVAVIPNRLSVIVQERVPIFVWRAGEGAWLIDRDGVALAAADLEADADAAALPQIEDRRTGEAEIVLGSRIDPLDLDVARHLGALTPQLVGSTATSLTITVDDVDGWVVAVPGGWRAVFGPYTPDLHTVDNLDLQVQCLRSLLADREPKVGTVVLAVSADRCGTFTDASPSPKPGRGGQPQPSPEPSR